MTTLIERQQNRKNELQTLLKYRGIRSGNLRYNDYVKYGDNMSALSVCNKMEENLFFEKLSRPEYYDLRDSKRKSKLLITYVEKNYENSHKILAEIPWHLKPKIDLIFELIKKGNHDQLNSLTFDFI
jgi:hypothetical protein